MLDVTPSKYPISAVETPAKAAFKNASRSGNAGKAARVSIRLIKSELLGESPGSNFAFNADNSTMAIYYIIANFLTYRGENGILDI